MTTMVFENLEPKANKEDIQTRLDHWKKEYPDLTVFLGSWKGKPAIVGSDEE